LENDSKPQLGLGLELEKLGIAEKVNRLGGPSVFGMGCGGRIIYDTHVV